MVNHGCSLHHYRVRRTVNVRYILLFTAIQLVAAILAVVGVFVVGALCLCKAWAFNFTPGAFHWPRAFWLWDNDEDGVCPIFFAPPSRWEVFVWSALRNPVNNFRFVPGVSKIGRPLFRKTWGAKPGGFYYQAGWNASGYPVLSGGRNANVF